MELKQSLSGLGLRYPGSVSNANYSILLNSFSDLLGHSGQALLNPSAYDTAWVARVGAEGNPKMAAFPQALSWLSVHQHEDGSWGEGAVPERLLATLAAIVTLTDRGQRTRDSQQVERGLSFIWQSLPWLQNTALLPIGFELLLSALVDEAQAVNLTLPGWLSTYYAVYQNQKKAILKKMSVEQIRNSTAMLSLEFLRQNLPASAESFVHPVTGGVGLSPAATAALIGQVEDPSVRRRMISYLERNKLADRGGNGWGFVTDFDIYEIIWVLYNLHICGHLTHPLLQPLVEPLLDRIAARWSPTGLPFSTYFFNDSDDTVVGYLLLHKSGRTSYDLSPVEGYWQQTKEYFTTYHYERDSSVSTNIHCAEAFDYAGQPDRVAKLLGFLGNSRGEQPYWMDKWHVSPYYVTAHAIICTGHLDKALTQPSVDWLYYTQHKSGGWGFEGDTTEETAYALQALVHYARIHGWSPSLLKAARAGANYLREHYRPFVWENEPLWTGKNRFTPYLIVRAAVLSAMLLAEVNKL